MGSKEKKIIIFNGSLEVRKSSTRMLILALNSDATKYIFFSERDLKVVPVTRRHQEGLGLMCLSHGLNPFSISVITL